MENIVSSAVDILTRGLCLYTYSRFITFKWSFMKQLSFFMAKLQMFWKGICKQLLSALGSVHNISSKQQ